MKRLTYGLLALTSLTLFGACAKAPAPNIRLAAETETNGIVNGKTVSAMDPVAQSTIALVMKKNGKAIGVCSAALITNQTIATAAHCFDENPDQVMAVFTTDIGRANQDSLRRVTKWEVHPRWGEEFSEGRGDIALAMYDGDLPKGYRPAKPLPTEHVLDIGDEFVIAGYGITRPIDKAREAGEEPRHLRKAEVKILGGMSETEVLSDGRFASICHGDSGGPAYVVKDGVAYVWGIASAVSSDKCNEFTVHTDILSYNVWVVETIKKLREKTPKSPVRPKGGFRSVPLLGAR